MLTGTTGVAMVGLSQARAEQSQGAAVILTVFEVYVFMLV